MWRLVGLVPIAVAAGFVYYARSEIQKVKDTITESGGPPLALTRPPGPNPADDVVRGFPIDAAPFEVKLEMPGRPVAFAAAGGPPLPAAPAGPSGWAFDGPAGARLEFVAYPRGPAGGRTELTQDERALAEWLDDRGYAVTGRRAVQVGPLAGVELAYRKAGRTGRAWLVRGRSHLYRFQAAAADADTIRAFFHSIEYRGR